MMVDHMRGKNKGLDIRSQETVFDGYFRIDRYCLRHEKHDGGWTAEFSREVFERGHAVAVLPYDPHRDEVVLIEQFRIGAHAAGLDAWLIEVVAGIIEPDEAAETVARRETKEECGCILQRLERIGHYLVSPGGASETCQAFCGQVDASQAAGIHGVAAEQEDIRALRCDFATAMAMIADGRIANAAAMITLQWLALNRQRLRHIWQ